jgi:hypothetical protein
VVGQRLDVDEPGHRRGRPGEDPRVGRRSPAVDPARRRAGYPVGDVRQPPVLRNVEAMRSNVGSTFGRLVAGTAWKTSWIILSRLKRK